MFATGYETVQTFMVLVHGLYIQSIEPIAKF